MSSNDITKFINSTPLLQTVRNTIASIAPEYKDASIANISRDVMGKVIRYLEEGLRSSSTTLEEPVRKELLNLLFATNGTGGFFNHLQLFMTSLDRDHASMVTPMVERQGYTFITRPRLCMQSSNLRGNRPMAVLDTLNNKSLAFAIRVLLDTNFHKANDGRYKSICEKSPIVDVNNPFFVPLCNSLTSFSGGEDLRIEPHTMEGGLHGESQTFAAGSDNMRRGNYTVNLTFKDVTNGPIFAIFYHWIEYIRCVTKGLMLAYADDIDEQILNYTVSIYRFLTDPSGKYITKFAKYTGCWPMQLPIQNMFNWSIDNSIADTNSLSIPFTCNVIETMDYAIIQDFNTLVRRYCPNINQGINDKGIAVDEENEMTVTTSRPIMDYQRPPMAISPLTNWRGMPYITSDPMGFRLEWRQYETPALGSDHYGDVTSNITTQLAMLELNDAVKSMVIKDNGTMSSSTDTGYIDGYYKSFDKKHNYNGLSNIDMLDIMIAALNSVSSSTKDDERLNPGSMRFVNAVPRK